MINAEVQLLDFTRETVTALADSYPLMIVTKGICSIRKQKSNVRA
jgi:hypothetical protein